MGNCKIEAINDTSESLKEVKLDNNESNLMNKSEGNNYKDKQNKTYRCYNNLKNSKKKENNYKIKNNILGKKLLNLNNINQKISKEITDNNEDELIIITPRMKNNNQYSESNANEITDEFTIKNETLVYVNDYITNKENDIKKVTNKNQSSNTNKIKGKMQRKKVNKSSNIKTNQLNKNKQKKINNLQKNNNNASSNNRKQNISKEQRNNTNIIKKNNINNLTQDMPFVKIDEMEYNKINNKNIKDNKDFLNINNSKQIPDSYLYKRKAKSKKNSKVFNKSYNNLLFNNFGINPLLDSFQISEIINANNKNPHSSTLQKQNIELENLLLKQLPLINSEIFLPNIDRKTYKEDLELQNNEQNNYANIRVPVFRKKTDFHIRNKSYNKYDFFNCNLTNDNSKDNNYFSLFNNSANLSINFIHNKFNKTAKNMNKVEPIMNNKNILSDRNNKSCCNKKVNMKKNAQDKMPQKKSNPYINYNNFNNKKNPNKKIKNRSNIQKSNQSGLSNSRSYNNIFQVNKNNKYEFNNTNCNINNMLLPSEQCRDMVEIYMPKIEKKTLICNEIINKPGNKYIFSYEKIDNFNIEQILYDGVIYKVIDNLENSENEYQFLDRYFQITKNSFRYYNNINDAINNKEKPLVQFDVRHIQNIEIIDSSIFGQSKINGNKNINIIFCIYIQDNNDFFVFSHYNKYVGNNIINILEFLIRYYEDNY